VALRSLGFEPRKDEVKKLMSDNDKDNSGKINKQQFVEIFRAKWVSLRLLPLQPSKASHAACARELVPGASSSTRHSVASAFRLQHAAPWLPRAVCMAPSCRARQV
jgi:hypothetical protein